MPRKNKPTDNPFVLFDVVYEDGSRSSNRRIPSGDLLGLDGDKPVKAIIEVQDREIGERSGLPRPSIKVLARSANQ